MSFAGIVAFQKGTCTEGEVEGETKGTFTLAANSPCSRNERQCFILFPHFQLQIGFTKKDSSDKRSRPFLHFLDFFSWLAEPGETFWEKGTSSKLTIYISLQRSLLLFLVFLLILKGRNGIMSCKRFCARRPLHQPWIKKKKGKCLQYSGSR